MTEHEPARWTVHANLDKYRVDPVTGIRRLYESLALPGNMLMYGGASALWNLLTDDTPTVTTFSNANAYLGVGDSSAAVAATQTDLQAATNKHREAMDATYPTHTDATTSGAATATFRSTYATGDANFAWNEWGVFNASTSGRMLNRKVQSMGTKTSADEWVLTVAITIS
jgi:hypothetical protein